MTVKVQWYGENVIRSVKTNMSIRLHNAGEALAYKIRDNLSVSGPPSSLPGEFPHKDTGELMESIEVRLGRKEFSIRVVAGTPYSKYVEESRPFMRRTLREMKSTIRSILLRGK
jgi:hypothetical protein